MSGLFKAYKTDATAEANGIPIKFHDAENEDGTVPTFFVAYMGSKANTRYAAAIEKARKPFQTLIDAGNQEAKEKFAARVNDLYCENIIKGWENVQDEHGQPIEFTKDAAKALMSELPAVLNVLVEASSKFENFRAADLEKREKN